jgi:hypothetical protein
MTKELMDSLEQLGGSGNKNKKRGKCNHKNSWKTSEKAVNKLPDMRDPVSSSHSPQRDHDWLEYVQRDIKVRNF